MATSTSLPIRPGRRDSSAGAALSYDFWQLYKSSKRDTGFILEWLRINAVENATRSRKSRSPIEDRMPVCEILRASELISKRRLAAPQYIRGAFKRTLVKRRALNQWYRQFEHDDPQNASRNESHEYFNDTLAKAYDLIFTQDNTPANDSGPATDQAPAAVTTEETKPAEEFDFKPSRNFYEILADIDEKEPESPTSEPTDQELVGVPEPREYVIVDDPLAEILDLHMFVLEMDAICAVAKQFWKLAANGQLPVPLAAWLTTAGFSALKQFSNVISPTIGGHEGLIRLYASKKAQLGMASIDVGKHEVEKSGVNIPYRGFSDGLGLTYPSGVLIKFKAETQHNPDFMAVVERKPISTYFLSATEESQQHEQFMQAVEATITNPGKPDVPDDQATAAKDRQAMESVLRSITQLIRNEETKGTFKKDDMNPLLHETRDYLASKEAFADTSLVVGIQMLLETCKSFVWLENSPNPMNCRMMALRFAQEVKQNIQSVNDQDLVAKNHTVPTAAGLVGVSDRLKAFLHEKRLDLYSQSPWAGGQQMVQILAYALEAGLSLCNQRGIVGTVLHAYNLVQQLTQAPTNNPLLDALSDLFLEPVFLGRLPTSNYQSIWLRFLGGGVDKKNIRGKDGKRFTITLPKRPKDSNNSADFQKRIDAFNLSLFHNLYASDWMGGSNFWAQVFTDRKKKTASKQEMLEMDAKLHKKPFGHALIMMSRVVASEFNSSFPIARVNFFAVYMICVNILTEIARRASENPPKELVWARDAGIYDTNVDAAAGFNFMALILMDIDTHVDKSLKSKVSEHSGLRIVQDSIKHVWAEKKLDDFFWKNL